MRRRHKATMVPCSGLLLLSISFAQQSAQMPKRVLTPEQKTYRQQEQAHVRLQAEGKQVFDFDGGTGGPSFDLECRLKLTRNHMRELDLIYGEDLHL
jgi:hypothetical protein